MVSYNMVVRAGFGSGAKPNKCSLSYMMLDTFSFLLSLPPSRAQSTPILRLVISRSLSIFPAELADATEAIPDMPQEMTPGDIAELIREQNFTIGDVEAALTRL